MIRCLLHAPRPGIKSQTWAWALIGNRTGFLWVHRTMHNQPSHIGQCKKLFLHRHINQGTEWVLKDFIITNLTKTNKHCSLTCVCHPASGLFLGSLLTCRTIYTHPDFKLYFFCYGRILDQFRQILQLDNL